MRGTSRPGRTITGCSEADVPLLLVLWREQHPQGHEQTMLRFNTQLALPEPIALFTSDNKTQSSYLHWYPFTRVYRYATAWADLGANLRLPCRITVTIWEHINLTGDYHWNGKRPKQGRFRTLRSPNRP